MTKLSTLSFLITLLLCVDDMTPLSAQTDLQAWGNITAIHVDDQPLRFETSLRIVKNWKWEQATGRERNWTRYRREGQTQIVRTRMDSTFFIETVTDGAKGEALVNIEYDPHKDLNCIGTFFHFKLPSQNFKDAAISYMESIPADDESVPVSEHEILRVRAKGIHIKSETRDLTIQTNKPILILVHEDPITGDFGIYFTVKSSNAIAHENVIRDFTINISGDSNIGTTELILSPETPGNQFLGFGGNFRLQNPRNDPQVIDYCLENLDVRMGRVEMPWQFWHSVDSIDPLVEARNGNLHPRVKAAMEMAKRLHDMDMPVLLAGWFPPGWAAVGTVSRRARNPDGTYGNPLDQDRIEEIYMSIGSYILYLKEEYGVEISMFSFNESDLGINVRQTAKEHAALIKGLGAHLRSLGINTKFLLGDTADANGRNFVNASLGDPETWEYIGAVSFHSWRGCTNENLQKWFDAADSLDVPLIIGEGSIDAAAWRYPQIFLEGHYAMEEIKLYVRILDMCQPQAILQWQLTSDYSPLAGGGVYGNDSVPLHPIRRFWNLKQLSYTPPNLHHLPMSCSNDDMFVAALGDSEKEIYTFHIVNDGPEHEVNLSGLPGHLEKLQPYITNKAKGMEKGKIIRVKNGEAKFRIEATSYVSLRSE